MIDGARVGGVADRAVEATRGAGGEIAAAGRTVEQTRSAGPGGAGGEIAAAGRTVEQTRSAGPGGALGGRWKVVVRNVDHNTFDHVARTLARVIPGVSLDQGYAFADRIHNSGLAIVWSGHLEAAEHYWEMLRAAGLTMAPLEQD
jgi:ATP-dependent Clp protease adaptor protein ClpS